MIRTALYGGLIALTMTMAGCATIGGDASGNVAPDKVVYHVSDVAHASAALRNIGNHLEVNPQAHIVVVTHAQGVKFDVCEITLRNRKLSKSNFIPESTFVPSGVAEITRLQQREGYAYLRP